jgi:hypothetical protein
MAFMPKPCQVRSHLESYMIDGNALIYFQCIIGSEIGTDRAPLSEVEARFLAAAPMVAPLSNETFLAGYGGKHRPTVSELTAQEVTRQSLVTPSTRRCARIQR